MTVSRSATGTSAPVEQMCGRQLEQETVPFTFPRLPQFTNNACPSGKKLGSTF
jgi:hypothetical protein